MKITNELKTGSVVVAAILVAAIFWMKTANFTGKTYRLKTQFNYAEGLKPDSIVKLSGIEIGRIENIKFLYTPDTKVEIVLLLSKSAKVHEDSIAFISSSGMVGDAYLGLTPGSPDKPFAKDGMAVASEDPVEMRKLMKKADAIADNLDRTLAQVKTLVSDNKAKVDSITANLESTTVNFKEFSEDIKQHPWKLLMKGK